MRNVLFIEKDKKKRRYQNIDRPYLNFDYYIIITFHSGAIKRIYYLDKSHDSVKYFV